MSATTGGRKGNVASTTSSGTGTMALDYPMHVVCSWIGNSAAVAAKHYLQVTDEHFRQGVAGPSGAAQQTAETQEMARKQSQQETQNPGSAGVCEPVQYCTSVNVGGTGLEPATSTV